jgi:beta-lactamase regulating signal transducer with metallopeptidase domain
MSFDMFVEWARWGLLGLANHLWQATLFAVVAAAASVLLGRAPARVRTAVWLAASAKFALPLALFAYLGRLAGLGAAPAASVTPAAESVWAIVAPVGATPAAAAAGAPSATGALYAALVGVWLAGAAVAFGVWIARRRSLSRAIRAGRPVGEGRERDALERARFRLGVEQEIGLVVSAEVYEPGVWRVRRPVLVLPEGVAEALSNAELEAVMMHEAAHVARRDNLLGNLQMALCCALWFHPVVWAIDRKLLAERERACDEAVIGAGGGARAYAAGLLKVFRFAIGWRPAGVSCATGSNLGRRIEQIMNTNDRISTNWHRAVVAAVVLAMAGMSAAAAALGQGEKRVTRQDVLIEKTPGPGPGEELAKIAAAAPTVQVVRTDNAAGTPLFITDAQIKKVPAEEMARAEAGRHEVNETFERKVAPPDGAESRAVGPAEGGGMIMMHFPETDADGNVLVMLVSLQNTSGHAITGYQMGGGSEENIHFFFGFNQPIAAGDTFQIAVPVGSPMLKAGDFALSVRGVQFDDGTTWGDFKEMKGMMMMRHHE